MFSLKGIASYLVVNLQHYLPGARTMPELLTKYFGSIEYRETDIVRFPFGLASFEQESQFLVIEPPGSAPLTFLQSLRLPSLCFLALPVEGVDPDYKLEITREDLASLGLQTGRQPRIGEEIRCFAVIVVAENGHISANLLAPVVINPATRRGVQAIRIDSIYSHQHSLTEAACS
jgi:flagellar assembly factor FliW